MKLNKSELRKILKDVIKELITEGAFDNAIKENVNPARVASNDFVNEGNDTGGSESTALGQGSPNQRLNELVRTAAGLSTGGNTKQRAIMESVLADTAATTYRNQQRAEGAGGFSESATEEEIKYDEAQLDVLSSGRGAKHWAAIAFGGNKKK